MSMTKELAEICVRALTLSTMNDIILNYGGDERFAMWWLEEGIPDCAPSVEIFELAMDKEDYDSIVAVYKEIIKAIYKEDPDFIPNVE